MEQDIEAIAGHVFECLTKGQQTAPFTDSLPGLDTASAYAVTAKLRVLREASGLRPVGRKVGFTNRTIWDEYGVFAPIWGDIYEQTVWHSDSAANGSLPLAGLCEPRIEPEIVFGLAAPIRADMGDLELLGALDWIAHGFEIVQSIYPDWKFQIADTIACGGLHGRMIVGPKHAVSGWQPETLAKKLAEFSIELRCNGALIDTGAGANVLDSPLNALRHLAQVLAEYPLSPPLAAGEIITTGTLTRAFPVSAGEVWATGLMGLDLPGLSVRFE